MGYLNNIVGEYLLTEGNISIDNITAALDNHNAVKINYIAQTEHDVASGERIIYPVAYGTSTKGNPVIRAFQPEGDTASKKPAWKLFIINGIQDWDITNEKFTTRDLPNFKIKKDAQMSIVFKSAFGSPEANIPINSTPVTKGEISQNKPETKIDINKPQEKPTAPLDNVQKKADIPTGIKPELEVGSETNPVLQKDIKQNTEVENPIVNKDEENNEEQQNTKVFSNEPIMQDDIENSEEENNDEENKEVKEIQNLTERINKIFNRK